LGVHNNSQSAAGTFKIMLMMRACGGSIIHNPEQVLAIVKRQFACTGRLANVLSKQDNPPKGHSPCVIEDKVNFQS
jgi:hypothetical protein